MHRFLKSKAVMIVGFILCFLGSAPAQAGSDKGLSGYAGVSALVIGYEQTKTGSSERIQAYAPAILFGVQDQIFSAQDIGVDLGYRAGLLISGTSGNIGKSLPTPHKVSASLVYLELRPSTKVANIGGDISLMGSLGVNWGVVSREIPANGTSGSSRQFNFQFGGGLLYDFDEWKASLEYTQYYLNTSLTYNSAPQNVYISVGAASISARYSF